MIEPSNTLHWATTVLTYEYTILFIIICIILVISLTFEWGFRKRGRQTKRLSLILMRLIEDHVNDLRSFIPKRLLKLPIVIPVMEKFDQSFTGVFWISLKEKLFHSLLIEDLKAYLYSRRWTKRSWALRALNLSPRYDYEEAVLSNLQSKKHLIRFSAARCAVKLNTKASISAVIRAMSQEKELCQYPYIDHLTAAKNPTTLAFIKSLYLETKNQDIRLSCLKILSNYVGYLTIEDVRPFLFSADPELRWCGLRSLANTPSKEGNTYLMQAAVTGDWQFQALATHLLGLLRFEEALDTLKRNLLSRHFWVRFSAGLSLFMFGEKGMQYLRSIKEEESEEAYRTAQHLLSMPSVIFKRGFQDFFPKKYADLFELETEGTQ